MAGVSQSHGLDMQMAKRLSSKSERDRDSTPTKRNSSLILLMTSTIPMRPRCSKYSVICSRPISKNDENTTKMTRTNATRFIAVCSKFFPAPASTSSGAKNSAKQRRTKDVRKAPWSVCHFIVARFFWVSMIES